MKATLVLGILCVLVSACSPAVMKPESKFAEGDKVTCRQVMPTGSHMPRQRCTTAEQSEQEGKDGRSILEQERQRQVSEEVLIR